MSCIDPLYCFCHGKTAIAEMEDAAEKKKECCKKHKQGKRCKKCPGRK